MYFTSNNGSQNTFIYQPTIELKKSKDTDYVLSWKLKRVYTSKLEQSYIAFLHNIKPSEKRMRIKFDKDPLAVKQNNYAMKTVNVQTV